MEQTIVYLLKVVDRLFVIQRRVTDREDAGRVSIGGVFVDEALYDIEAWSGYSASRRIPTRAAQSAEIILRISCFGFTSKYLPVRCKDNQDCNTSFT